jgi:C-terminal processing protease CtpA/Prc
MKQGWKHVKDKMKKNELQIQIQMEKQKQNEIQESKEINEKKNKKYEEKKKERERWRRSEELQRAALEADVANSGQDYNLRVNPELAAQRETQDRAEMERRQRYEDHIRKKEQYERSISQGVNISQLNAEQMRKVKQGLSDLFKGELNPILE